MPRKKVVTAQVISQIESWVDAGLSPKAIAEKIGCTVGTLKVRCSQHRISLRRKTHVAMRGRGRSLADLSYERVDVQSPRRDEQTAARSSKQMIDPEEAEHLVLWVPQPILCGLRRWATLKGISEVALAEMLLKTIVEDDLYEAVLEFKGNQ